METFSVQREFMKAVLVEKKVLEKIDVSIYDIHPREVRLMPFQQVQKYAVVMLREYHLLKKEFNKLKSASRPQGKGIEPPSATPSPSTEEKVEIVVVDQSTGNSGDGSTIGRKLGKTSKYHYINVQTRDDKFYTFNASTSLDGKTVNMGRSKDEIQCALLADEYLDKIGDNKRKRNRDEFPEVMEAYMQKADDHAER